MGNNISGSPWIRGSRGRLSPYICVVSARQGSQSLDQRIKGSKWHFIWPLLDGTWVGWDFCTSIIGWVPLDVRNMFDLPHYTAPASYPIVHNNKAIFKLYQMPPKAHGCNNVAIVSSRTHHRNEQWRQNDSHFWHLETSAVDYCVTTRGVHFFTLALALGTMAWWPLHLNSFLHGSGQQITRSYHGTIHWRDCRATLSSMESTAIIHEISMQIAWTILCLLALDDDSACRTTQQN